MMTANQLINLLATITLIEMMATIGLGVTLADVAGTARNWRLVIRTVLANYVFVPAAAVGLILLFHAEPMVAVGFLIVAVCPGAPYGPPFTAMARGNVVMAVGMMIILAGSSAIVAPLLLHILLPVVAGNTPLKLNVAKMISTLALSQFLPMCAGLYVRQRHPVLAARLKKPAGQVSILLNLSLVGFILAVQFRMLMAIRLAGYLGMLALLIATMFAGWLAGGPGNENRKSLVLTTSVRNVGVSLVIAASSFPGTAAVTAATAYAIFQTVIMAFVALAWGRYWRVRC
jgi:BASS family bile acid:Na+ symporter